MRASFKTLASVGATHAFRSGDAQPLGFVLPTTTRSQLAGARTLARVFEGRLLIASEIGEAGTPLASLAGRSLLIGLKPAEDAFASYTDAPVTEVGALPLYENRSNANALDAPVPVRWRGTGPAEPGVIVEPDFAVASPWALLKLNVAASHYTTPAVLTVTLEARRETLRYYVVAQHYGAAEFEQLRVVDRGFADDARAEVHFERVLPPAFGAQHLSPALLDAAGDGRIALFQSTVPVARRARALRRLSLHRNGDVLIEHLPSPGAARADAQFILHLSKPS